MQGYMPDKDKDFQTWAENFVAVAGDNLTILGLTPADLTALSADVSGFGAGLGAVADAKAQMERAVIEKDAARRNTEKDVRGLVRRIQAHPGVSDGLKAQLGITVKSAVVNRTPPVQPSTLVATPNADGTNTLKWHKAGNKAATQFVVLAKPLTGGVSATADSGWTMVGTTTKAVFAHQGVTPGVPMAYKVLAARAGFVSPASLPATVYTS